MKDISEMLSQDGVAHKSIPSYAVKEVPICSQVVTWGCSSSIFILLETQTIYRGLQFNAYSGFSRMAWASVVSLKNKNSCCFSNVWGHWILSSAACDNTTHPMVIEPLQHAFCYEQISYFNSLLFTIMGLQNSSDNSVTDFYGWEGKYMHRIVSIPMRMNHWLFQNI